MTLTRSRDLRGPWPSQQWLTLSRPTNRSNLDELRCILPAILTYNVDFENALGGLTKRQISRKRLDRIFLNFVTTTVYKIFVKCENLKKFFFTVFEKNAKNVSISDGLGDVTWPRMTWTVDPWCSPLTQRCLDRLWWRWNLPFAS